MEEFGRAGHLDRQVAGARDLYAKRCALMMEGLERHLPDGVSWTRPNGGFFTWLTLPEGKSAADVARAGMERGVAVVPGVPFYPDGRGTNNLRLSFSKVADPDIDEGTCRLAEAISASRDHP